MANNDSVLIPYVIQEGSFWYVAYKEKNPFVPEITVSAKGIANHMSEEINDGYDFGPDSYNPSVTSGVPLTQTSGIQEAWDYVFLPTSPEYLNKVVLKGGGKIYIDVPLIMRSSYVNVSIAGEGGDGFSQIQCSSNFTGNYLIDLELQGNIRFSGIRLTPQLPDGTKIDYGLYFNNSSSNSNQYWESFTFDAASISQLYQNTNVNGRTFFTNVLFNGGGQYSFYTTQPNSLFQFIKCTINSTIYSVPTTPGSQLMFTECQNPYINSLNSSPNLQNTNIWIANSDMSLSGTAQIGDFVHIWATNVRFSQNSAANYFNIQGTNVNILIRGGYSDYNGGGSGTFYIITAQSGASGYVSIEKIMLGNTSSGTTLSIGDQTIIPVNTKEITLNPNNVGTVQYSSTPTLSANPPVSGTVYQNTNPYAIEIDLPAYASTSGTAGYVTVAKGSTDTPTAIASQYVSGDTSSSSVDIVRLRVPAGWYYEFTSSGVTFGTASVFAD